MSHQGKGVRKVPKSVTYFLNGPLGILMKKYFEICYFKKCQKSAKKWLKSVTYYLNGPLFHFCFAWTNNPLNVEGVKEEKKLFEKKLETKKVLNELYLSLFYNFSPIFYVE